MQKRADLSETMKKKKIGSKNKHYFFINFLELYNLNCISNSF